MVILKHLFALIKRKLKIRRRRGFRWEKNEIRVKNDKIMWMVEKMSVKRNKSKEEVLSEVGNKGDIAVLRSSALKTKKGIATNF